MSVRNPSEAISAWQGGADIIDLKEPQNGPLGAVPAEIPGSVFGSLHRLNSSSFPALSIALGETRDWLLPFAETPERGALLESIRRIVSAVRYLKMGLSTESGTDMPGPKQILQRWVTVRHRIENEIAGRSLCSEAPTEGASGPSDLMRSGTAGPEWVAVAYADAERSGAPSIKEVVTAAIETGCRGLLIDTFLKDGRGLFGCCSQTDLSDARNRTRDAGLFLALAGQITVNEMFRLKPFQPDIIAVRGSACRSGKRSLEVDEEAVRDLKHHLRSTF